MMFTDKIISADEHRAWFEKMQGDESLRYLVFEHCGKPLGLIYFTGIDFQTGTCTWGFYLGVSGLPRGTGTVMGILGIEYAFEQLSISKVCGETRGFNIAGIRYHEQMGFVRQGSRRILRNGIMEEVISFVLSRESWRPKKQQLKKKFFLQGE